jgi:trk system potassium uptake protein TrkA
MRVIIIGCGRVGARTATELDEGGHHVTVIDIDQRAFNRLPESYGGVTVRGPGDDEDVLRGAGGEMADLLMALTEGDNRNAMAAQLGKHVFRIPRVIAKINDPVRAEAYRSLGLETICRTVILADALVKATTEGAAADANVLPPTAEPLQGAPVVGTFNEADAARAAGRPVPPSADAPAVEEPEPSATEEEG